MIRCCRAATLTYQLIHGTIMLKLKDHLDLRCMVPRHKHMPQPPQTHSTHYSAVSREQHCLLVELGKLRCGYRPELLSSLKRLNGVIMDTCPRCKTALSTIIYTVFWQTALQTTPRINNTTYRIFCENPMGQPSSNQGLPQEL